MVYKCFAVKAWLGGLEKEKIKRICLLIATFEVK
jgi:hypothetical protein